MKVKNRAPDAGDILRGAATRYRDARSGASMHHRHPRRKRDAFESRDLALPLRVMVLAAFASWGQLPAAVPIPEAVSSPSRLRRRTQAICPRLKLPSLRNSLGAWNCSSSSANPKETVYAPNS